MTEPWCKELPDYELIHEADGRCVVMDDGLGKEYSKIKHQDKATLTRWIENWCKPDGNKLPAEKFKPQETYTDDKGKSVKICVFKSHQGRLYGFERSWNGKQVFFITSIDPKKKSDDAKPSVLKRAKEEAFRILETLGMR